MSNEKSPFLSGFIYIFVVTLFSLMLLLGASATIWQLVSKSHNGGVSSAFNFVSAQFDGKSYVFTKCNVEDVEMGEIVLYNQSAQSDEITLSMGKLMEVRPDDNFGEIVIHDTILDQDVVRPTTYFLGVLSGEDGFSYAMVTTLNEPIMFYLFTLFPIVVLAGLILYRVYQNKKDGNAPKRLSKREQKLAQIVKSNK